MKIKQLMKKYEECSGEKNYQLGKVEDLLCVHEIDYKSIQGVERLTDENKDIIKIFLVRFYNAWGLEARSTIQPIAIHRVLRRTYWNHVKVQDSERMDIPVCVKEEHIAIEANGKELFQITERIDKEYIQFLSKAKKKEEIYLRFEYKIYGRRDWLHIVDGGYGWY